MRKNRNERWLAAGGTLLLFFIVLGYVLVGGKDPGKVRANAGVTTEQAATEAGAKVLPTDPALKIESK